MKWIITCLLATSALLLSACSSHYVMTSKDGQMIMTRGKPVIDKETGLISYVDESGHEKQINGDEISSMVER
ncbi:DUF903 domain-containing protein [Erwinia sp. OLTSP20]|uniref:YgdI/YgdR family lipoprotein n=1 Tax=unclassified Erwinia TaxID=2622719 RepID=UPI000C18ED63|nr:MULTISPECIES: YgdI/YgdR family lipoprotein [unclassified Erwinia]PIJ49015.1 DUF903 domain-containing protein [Erwinia sp. OAMSP11]PIJ75009.1 DUF903 domain-containing protein [Erwinia sp. OLSSP12]PIJ79700.1 DUF903 domain-containing protein [Erwinia sp. OLCASP19]PIJ80485.1 DUF903 domain-containing protein [Erwinia sp. OLMTSP26]PIJ82600.1 DUF903 domain-containing protein [Erwinia sp. OLMDSP33]